MVYKLLEGIQCRQTFKTYVSNWDFSRSLSIMQQLCCTVSIPEAQSKVTAVNRKKNWGRNLSRAGCCGKRSVALAKLDSMHKKWRIRQKTVVGELYSITATTETLKACHFFIKPTFYVCFEVYTTFGERRLFASVDWILSQFIETVVYLLWCILSVREPMLTSQLY